MVKKTEIEFGRDVRFTMTVRLRSRTRNYIVRDYGHRIAIDADQPTRQVVKIIKMPYNREPDKFTAMVKIREILDDKGKLPEDL